MDMAVLHSWWTVAMLVAFIGIVLWAFSGRRRKQFEEAANIPLDDDDPPTRAGRDTRRGEKEGSE